MTDKILKKRHFSQVMVEISMIVLALWLMIDNVMYAMQVRMETGEIGVRVAMLAALSLFCFLVFIQRHLNMRKVRADEIFSKMQRSRSEDKDNKKT